MAIFERPFYNFYYKSSPNICSVLVIFEKFHKLCKNIVSTFLGNFCEVLVYFKLHHLVTLEAGKNEIKLESVLQIVAS